MTDKPLIPEVAGKSDVGNVRKTNEDNWGIRIPREGSSDAELGAMLIVADGVGSLGNGDLASRTVVDTLRSEYYETSDPQTDIPARLTEAIRIASLAVQQRTIEMKSTGGMGSTLAGLLLFPDKKMGYSFNVGDSRVYRKKKADASAEQLSLDDVRSADDRNDEALTQYMGQVRDLAPRIRRFDDLDSADTFLICSDGLWKLLTEEEIFHVVEREASADDAAAVLIAQAKGRGAPDNVTVIIASMYDPTAVGASRGRSSSLPLVIAALIVALVLIVGAGLMLSQNPPAAETPTSVAAEATAETEATVGVVLNPTSNPVTTRVTSAAIVLQVTPSVTPSPSDAPTETRTPSQTPSPNARASQTAQSAATALAIAILPTDMPTETATASATPTPPPNLTATERAEQSQNTATAIAQATDDSIALAASTDSAATQSAIIQSTEIARADTIATASRIIERTDIAATQLADVATRNAARVLQGTQTAEVAVAELATQSALEGIAQGLTATAQINGAAATRTAVIVGTQSALQAESTRSASSGATQAARAASATSSVQTATQVAANATGTQAQIVAQQTATQGAVLNATGTYIAGLIQTVRAETAEALATGAAATETADFLLTPTATTNLIFATQTSAALNSPTPSPSITPTPGATSAATNSSAATKSPIATTEPSPEASAEVTIEFTADGAVPTSTITLDTDGVDVNLLIAQEGSFTFGDIAHYGAEGGVILPDTLSVIRVTNGVNSAAALPAETPILLTGDGVLGLDTTTPNLFYYPFRVIGFPATTDTEQTLYISRTALQDAQPIAPYLVTHNRATPFRERASATSNLIVNVPSNQTFTILATQRGGSIIWYQVQYLYRGNIRTGWIGDDERNITVYNAELLSLITPTP